MQTKRVGNISEAALLKALTSKGRAVLVPWGDNERYDLVVEETDGRFSRVQCKTGRLVNGVIKVDATSSSTKGRRGYGGQVEYIGVYCPQIDKTYLVPMDQIGDWGFYLRLEPTKNHQAKAILWAKDFEV